MKRDSFITAICCIVIAVIMWIAIMAESASADDGSSWNECGSHEVQDIMWDYLIERFDNPVAAAAIMGNAGVESNFCPWRYTGDNNVEDGYSASRTYVDSCSKEKFTYCWLYTFPAGWGIFQFATNGHMQAIWELAEEKEVPVYDVELQCSYMLDNLEAKLPDVYQYFFDCEDLVDATEVFRAFGEGSTFSERSVIHRTNRALEVYERYMDEEYAGKIYFPMWNGGSLHELKG